MDESTWTAALPDSRIGFVYLSCHLSQDLLFRYGVSLMKKLHILLFQVLISLL